VENLSDAVFGFAVTLLVVSSQVPMTFPELKEMLRLFVPFGVCMLALGMIWHAHFVFFRRYGLVDGTTMLLNGALLFVVVFFLYPLKFLATMLFNLATGHTAVAMATRGNADTLLAIYSAGYAAVFLLLAAFYAHAWRRREELELTEVEGLITRQTRALLLVHVAVALLVLGLALATDTTGLAGAGFFLIGPLSYAVGARYGRLIRAATAEPAPAAPAAPAPSA